MMPLYATAEDMIGDRKNRLVMDDDDEEEVGGEGEGNGDEEERERQGQGQGEGKKSRRNTGEDAAALSLFCNTPKVRTIHQLYYDMLCVFLKEVV